MKQFVFFLLIILNLLACEKQAPMDVFKTSLPEFYNNHFTHTISNNSDELNYTISLPDKFNYSKELVLPSCTHLEYATFLIPEEKANVMIGNSGWAIDLYELFALVDSTYTFDFYQLNQNLYPRFSKGTRPNFNHRDIIPRFETPILGQGIIRLENNYQVHYVLYTNYSSTILDAYIANPEHIVKLSYEQFNYTNYAQIDSALIAFQTFRTGSES